MRTFVAIDLDTVHLDALELARQSITASTPEWTHARWVPRQNLHVTLKFMGDVSGDAIEGLTVSLATCLRDLRTAELIFDVVEAIPAPRGAKMIWARFADPENSVTDVATAIDAALVSHGVSPDKRTFRPHVTLARTRKPRAVALSATESATVAARSALGQDRVMSVGEATLYKSTLSRTGATYEILAKIPLGTSR